MKVFKTNFDGLIVFHPKVFQDNRGEFYESWRKKTYKSFGIQEDLIQDNISVAKKNVLKGLHYQKDQGQLVTISYGRIFDVVVDIRSESNTYGRYYSTVLDASEPTQIYMAPGFAHGFCVLSDLAIIHYKCSEYYNPEQEGGIAWNDPTIGIQWPKITPIISTRDQAFPNMS